MNERPVDRDLETARTIRNWLERTAERVPDDPTGRERLLEHVDRSSQRSARWLPPVFPGGVSWVFSAPRLTAVIAMAIICAGLLLVVSVPREEARVGVPGSETASPSPPASPAPARSASVTGTIVSEKTVVEPVTDRQGQALRQRAGYRIWEVEWSDARLPPDIHVWSSADEYVLDPAFPSRRGGVVRGRVYLSDASGAWDGDLEAVYPQDDRDMTAWLTLVGSGEYTDLHAVLVVSQWPDAGLLEFGHEIVGLIAEGEPPPTGVPPSTSDRLP